MCRIIRLSFFLCITAVFFQGSISNGQVYASPSVISVEETESKKLVDGFFYLENTAERDVKIESVFSSCRCLSVKKESDIIPGKGHTKIVFIYESDGHPGKLPQTIYVVLSNPKSLLKITVKSS